MIVENTLSSCIAIYSYISESALIRSFLIFIFIIIPSLKLVFSYLKTTKKIFVVQKKSVGYIPNKLKKIIKFHHLNSNLFLVSSQQNLEAVSVGFFNKKIVLTKKLISLLSVKELEAVVLHELYHTKFHHSIVLFISEFLSNVFFFLPVFKDVQFIIKSRFETAADSYATSLQKTNRYVKQSLRKIISTEDLVFYPQFSYSIIESRIDRLNKKNISHFLDLRRSFISVAVLFFLTALFLLNKKYAMAAMMEEKIQCSLFSCVRDCVAQELMQPKIMSENNYSIALPQE